ncbi:glucuronide uptake porin UidC [Pantoea coffeiphila]|uniref:glucuronide uptake porin UidC n=1 Tax=Pantoea coffeiphila TaxID=1465635 RepID=UPI00195F7B20|nr:glucuronide uptake porin UidC [Pantoea coffeiphila]MBM7343975.1 putative glucuronide porin [Pantoea coffeiphila]
MMTLIARNTLIGGCVLLCSWPLYASSFNQQDEDEIRLRLRNELRRADKPSAGSGRDIYAWVQGAALEYNSRYFQDRLGVDIGDFYVYKLGARNNWSSRWYLNGTDSFNRYTAALKFKVSEQLYIKAGRMVTDSAYTGGKDLLIINSSSQRTVPTLSDAVLMQYRVDDELDIYAMYRHGIYTYPDVAEGVHKTGPVNPETYRHDTLRAQYIAALAWQRQCDNAGLAVSWQEDVAAQVMTKAARCIPLAGDGQATIKPEFMAFYARLNGTSAGYDGPDNAWVMSGQLSYIVPRGRLSFGVGKTGNKPNGLSGIDTDLGYPFDLSIDRNHSDMWSVQLGGTLNLPGDTFVGIAPILTHGYEDTRHRVTINGLSTNLLFGYQPQGGLFKGAKALLVLNKAREHRNGSAFGDRLDYYDIKMNLQYDFILK